MFLIKTDIRQYKCENKAKVEKLIHNWVVRPTDLIFEDDQWQPIGKHSEFETLFKILAKEDAGDTVVTDSPFEESEEPEKKVEAPKEREDVFDQEDILRDLTTKPEANFTPPVAPDNLEPAHHDDEVTMMTDRTLDMLMDYDPSLKEDSENVASPVDSEEATQIVESPLKDEKEKTADIPEDEETTGVKESPLEKEETTNVKESPLEKEETTNVKESPLEKEETTNVKESPLEIEADDDLEERITTPALEETSAPKLGRHDLPEDFFATNEISKVNREDVQKLDDLNEKEKAAADLVEEKVEDSVDDAWSDIESEYSDTEIADSLGEVSDSFDEEEKDPSEVEEAEVEEIKPESEEVLHINGYEIDFPFPIGPTAEDIKIGLKSSKYDLVRREKTYPHPYEKEYKTAHIRAFDWKREPPKDLSAVVIIGVVIFLFISVLLISQC